MAAPLDAVRSGERLLNVALGKFADQMTASEALAYLDRILWTLCKIHPNAGLTQVQFLLSEETGWTLYDSLIVSAAAAARCRLLWTEDLQAGRVIRGVEIRNPFA